MDPPRNAPYLILVCLARSSALSMGESMRSTVRKAARLAVYEEIMISVKNHHIPATIRVETALLSGWGEQKEQRLGFDGMGIDWVKVRMVLIKVGQFILIPFLDLSTE